MRGSNNSNIYEKLSQSIDIKKINNFESLGILCIYTLGGGFFLLKIERYFYRKCETYNKAGYINMG